MNISKIKWVHVILGCAGCGKQEIFDVPSYRSGKEIKERGWTDTRGLAMNQAQYIEVCSRECFEKVAAQQADSLFGKPKSLERVG